MSDEPAGELEALLRQEETALRDDGFSARVIEGVNRHQRVRRIAVYGAGMAGFGAAVGGVVELAQDFPAMTSWMAPLRNATESISVGTTVDSVASAVAGGAPGWLAAAVAVAGACFFMFTVLTQER